MDYVIVNKCLKIYKIVAISLILISLLLDKIVNNMNLIIVTAFSGLVLCQINFGSCSHRHKKPYYHQAKGLHLEGDPHTALKRATYYTQQNTYPITLPSKSSYHVEVIEQKGGDNSWNSYLTSIGEYPDLYRNAFPYPGYPPYGSNCQTEIVYQREFLEDPLAAFKSLNINPEVTQCYKSKQYLQPEVISVKSPQDAKLERIEVKSSDALGAAIKLANSLAFDEIFPYTSSLPCNPEISILQPSIQISEPAPCSSNPDKIEENLVTGDQETPSDCGIQNENIFVDDKIQVKETKFGDNNSVLQVIVPEVKKEPCGDGKKGDESESSEESDENSVCSSKEGGPVIQNRFVLFHFRDNGAPIKSAILKLLAKI